MTVVAVLVLGGCPQGGPPVTQRTPVGIDTAPSAILKAPFRTAPAPPVPGARRGGTVHVLGDYGISTLDPSEAYYTDTVAIEGGLLIRSLTQYVYDPQVNATVLVPDLATDLGRSRDHFKTWSFTLRRGVKYQNGEPITPDDMRFGIERSLDRQTFPAGAAFSNDYFLDGHTYPGPYRSRTPYRGVSLSGRRITIRMARPFPDMPYWASYPAMSPIPPGAESDPVTYKLHPLATGPYKIQHYEPDTSLVLVRNPQWDPSTDPGRHQYVDRFVMNFQTPVRRIDAMILGDTATGRDAVSEYSVQASDYERFRSEAPNRLLQGATPCSYLWWPDNRNINDIRVRRALAWAFPYRAAWRAAGEIPGVTRLPATNILPPGTPGRVTYNPLPGHTPGSTNPVRSRALLTQAGKVGYPVSWAFAKDVPSAVAVTKVLVRAFSAAGFHPRPRPTLSVDLTAQFSRNPNAPVNLRQVGWCSDWPSGLTWLPPMFSSDATPDHEQGYNFAFFGQSQIDRRLASIPTLPLARQPRAWNDLDRDVQTHYFPVIVTGYGGVALMRGARVHGAHVDSVYSMPTYKDIWLG